MTLFQLLSKISLNIPLILFDINGAEITRVLSKSHVSIDLYEYEIFAIESICEILIQGISKQALAITLLK